MTQVKKTHFHARPLHFGAGYVRLYLMKRITPLIVPRPEHTVSRSNLSPNAVKALYRLKGQGFTAYLVGGCVRDLLLGREPKDFDVATNATPQQVMTIFPQTYAVGAQFGVVLVPAPDAGGASECELEGMSKSG